MVITLTIRILKACITCTCRHLYRPHGIHMRVLVFIIKLAHAQQILNLTVNLRITSNETEISDRRRRGAGGAQAWRGWNKWTGSHVFVDEYCRLDGYMLESLAMQTSIWLWSKDSLDYNEMMMILFTACREYYHKLSLCNVDVLCHCRHGIADGIDIAAYREVPSVL